MRSKLYAVFTGILCVCVVIACEIPQSVTVKGQPGVYLNLGSPFGSENILTDKFLDVDSLRGQMGDSFTGRIYTYRGDSDATDVVQTYLISFPIIPQFTLPAEATGYPMEPRSVEIPNLALHEIADFLGGAEFDAVPAYLYVSGLTGGKMTLTYKISEVTTALLNNVDINSTLPNPFITATLFADKAVNVVTWETSDIPAVPTVDLRPAFNAESDVTLGFTINGTVAGGPIKADLVIKLPLRFSPPLTKEGVSQEVTIANKEYVKLALDALPTDDEDLFGREGNDDDLFDQLQSVTVYIKAIENTAIGNLKLGISRKNQIISLDNDPGADYKIQFANSELDHPFNPGFLVLVEKANNKIIIKPQADGVEAKFDFKLALEAQADLNINQKLN
ncbi:hypothetical protein LQZ19_13200 [Treponema primitia]|uniref:hypothetical protein n=1 Tax=Treponema primitia TaxID=88058 RepID=UPI00397F5473